VLQWTMQCEFAILLYCFSASDSDQAENAMQSGPDILLALLLRASFVTHSEMAGQCECCMLLLV
jgi:hypothetical protein